MNNKQKRYCQEKKTSSFYTSSSWKEKEHAPEPEKKGAIHIKGLSNVMGEGRGDECLGEVLVAIEGGEGGIIF